MPASCAITRTRPALELADVVRVHGKAFSKIQILRPEESAALRAIEQCRTAVLGGHLEVCTACGHEPPSYNSCRNRHCPKCQSVAQAQWVERRLERILPVHYFHVVFTLLAELRLVALRFREAVFDMLFANASATLLALARAPAPNYFEDGLPDWQRESLVRLRLLRPGRSSARPRPLFSLVAYRVGVRPHWANGQRNEQPLREPHPQQCTANLGRHVPPSSRRCRRARDTSVTETPVSATETQWIRDVMAPTRCVSSDSFSGPSTLPTLKTANPR